MRAAAWARRPTAPPVSSQGLGGPAQRGGPGPQPTHAHACTHALERTTLTCARTPELTGLKGHPFFFDMAHSRLECEIMCFGAIQELLDRVGVTPKQARLGGIECA